MKKMLPLVCVFLITALVLIGEVISREASDFHRIEKSTYKTPWFSTNWLVMPYTNFKLSGLPVKEYWTVNAVGSERWLVREVELNGKTYWTTLQRLPISRS